MSSPGLRRGRPLDGDQLLARGSRRPRPPAPLKIDSGAQLHPQEGKAVGLDTSGWAENRTRPSSDTSPCPPSSISAATRLSRAMRASITSGRSPSLFAARHDLLDHARAGIVDDPGRRLASLLCHIFHYAGVFPPSRPPIVEVSGTDVRPVIVPKPLQQVGREPPLL